MLATGGGNGMANRNGISDYRARLERVQAHIRAHLDGPLNLDELADVACLSRFHWHRTYRGLTGETVWQTVKRLRLHRAAAELVRSSDPVEKIALRSGYTNARAFSQAFKADYGLPPIRYRAEGGHRRYEDISLQEVAIMYDVRIEDQTRQIIAGYEHTGPYVEIGAAFERLGAEISRQGAWGKSACMAAVYFDDPDIKAPEALCSLAGMVVKTEEQLPEGFTIFEKPPGRYAILTHRGPYAELSKAYHWFFGAWLAGSSETPAATPAFECYLNSPIDTAPTDLLNEIHMHLG
jgi:AraC family transcriptional regulator